MKLYRELLSRARLSVISAVTESELDRIAGIVSPSFRVRDRADLEDLLGRLLAAAADGAAIEAKTLDLIGHSTSASLLQLGSWVIDAASRCVTSFFRGLTDEGVLPRLGITAVRLLACKTASAEQGRTTLCALGDILGLEVFGTEHLLFDQHYDEDGFREVWEFMLVSSRDLRRTARPPALTSEAGRWPRTLELDELPAHPLASSPAPWPQRVATGSATREILQLIRRNAGARMPGLIATPSCELALPSAMHGAYHLMHVLFDGAFVRCFPDGITVPGVVYPVEDAPRLHRIVGELPLLELTR